MKIPKLFGNKIVLIVLALALFLIIIISLVNLGNIALTGFAGSDKEKKSSENLIIEENPIFTENNEEDFEISALPEEETSNIFTETPTLKNIKSNKKGGNKGGNSNSGNSNNNNQNSNNENNNNPNEENSNNQNTENPSENQNNNPNETPSKKTKSKLSKKPNNLELKQDEREISEGEEFQGKVRLNLGKHNKKIATFDINFSEDIDLSDIIADSDFTLGKAYMHSTSGKLENIDLYVPVEEGDIAVVVCSNADNYNEIYYGCGENPEITKEELLYLSGPRVERSEDGLYFIVHGITGTGAMGVNVTEINSTRQDSPPPGKLDGFAGNVTEITTPEGMGTTQAWAGYFGNVTGTIMLADNGDNVMYNWSLSSPEGEIFASTNNSILWNHIQCFNFTSTGTYQDESGNGGSTNLYGTNLTQLEETYGIEYNDLDGVDETFYLIGPGTHNTFYVNANEFQEGECYNTRIFDYSGAGQDNNFEEILLYEPVTSSVVFASILNENVLGFDNRSHDFEMIVLENGHNTDTNTTTYYFYAVVF